MATVVRPARRVEGHVPERAILGFTLLGIAAIVAAGAVVPDLDRWTLLGVATLTLAAFAITREYGFAIAAGITGGMGTAIALITSGTVAQSATAAAFFLPLATGFAAVWVLGLVARPRETHPWPLVPAAILGSLGFATLIDQPGALDWVGAGIAVAFAVAGAGLLLRRSR
jgi:hypothetical protein